MPATGIGALVFFDAHEPEYSEALTAAERQVRGQPARRTWHHFTSTDGKFLAGYWEADAGCWRIRYTENEFCHILGGVSVLRDTAGNERCLGIGDECVIPAGFESEREVVETTRKRYVIYAA